MAASRAAASGEDEQAARWPSSPAASGSAFSEDADFDELDDLGRRAGRDRFGRRVRSAPLSTGRQRAAGRGRRARSSSPSGPATSSSGPCRWWASWPRCPRGPTSWHHFFSGWQSAGVGTTAPASPAFGIVGLTGTVLFGAMGTLQRVLLLGCIPLGAWGVSRFMRPLVSPRARVVAVICYLGLPLPYGALGTGRWDGLVAYAAFPFIALRLARAAGVDPYAVEPGPHWRSRPAGQVAVLGAVIAAAAGVRAGRRARWCSSWRVAWVAGLGPRGRPRAAVARRSWWRCEAVGVALVLAAPWVVGTVLAGKGSVAIFGLPARPERPRRAGARCSASPSARPPGRPWPGSWSSARRCPLVIGRGHQAGLGGAPVGAGARHRGAWPTPPRHGDLGLLHALRDGGAGTGRAGRGRCASASGSPPSRTT